MQGAGFPLDAMGGTLLVMAHEKAGDWEGAQRAYERMRTLGLPRSSFTYRRVRAARGRCACSVCSCARARVCRAV